jgi:hypothetical protein
MCKGRKGRMICDCSQVVLLMRLPLHQYIYICEELASDSEVLSVCHDGVGALEFWVRYSNPFRVMDIYPYFPVSFLVVSNRWGHCSPPFKGP